MSLRTAAGVTACLATLVLAGGAPEVAASQTYPSRPITIVVPQPPAGQTDTIARTVSERLGSVLGQPVTIANVAGASGTIGVAQAMKAPPDGYTLLLGGTATLAIGPSLFAHLGPSPDDRFVPIRELVRVPFALAANSRVPAASVAELVRQLKASPDALNCGTTGPGSNAALAAGLFRSRTGTRFVDVPYRGAAQQTAALVAGEVDLSFQDLSLLLPHAQSGAIRLLATAGARRAPLAPGLPTLAEQGVPGVDVTPWFALLAPAGTPREIVDRLKEATNEVMRMRDVRERFLALGYEPIDPPSGDLAAFLREERARYEALIRALGIRAEP